MFAHGVVAEMRRYGAVPLWGEGVDEPEEHVLHGADVGGVCPGLGAPHPQNGIDVCVAVGQSPQLGDPGVRGAVGEDWGRRLGPLPTAGGGVAPCQLCSCVVGGTAGARVGHNRHQLQERVLSQPRVPAEGGFGLAGCGEIRGQVIILSNLLLHIRQSKFIKIVSDDKPLLALPLASQPPMGVL